ncbi:hypothetical protein M9Y10_007922 [Tritrichomonas musculus]|uniref:Ankyrin repeat protein n=1 Tax=Tritrichomonas musculus TaxID=1915356 RepID=A0ABR2J3F0_9EUKA
MLAISDHHEKIAKLLIEHPKTNINMKNYDDISALSFAVDEKLDEIGELLLNDKRFDPEENDINYAFFFSSPALAKKIISFKNVDVNCIFRRQNDNNSKSKKVVEEQRLIRALHSNDLEMVDLIKNHPSFDIGKYEIQRILSLAISSNKIEFFQVVMSIINNDINSYKIRTKSIFFYAIESASLDIVKEILYNQNYNFSDNIVDDFIHAFNYTSDSSPQITAPIDIMNELYEYDQKHDKLIDMDKLLPNGKSYFTSIPLNLSNTKNVVNFFLEHGSDPNAPDKNGVYPLQYAISINSREFIFALVDSKKVDINKRITYKNELDFTDSISQTYLHMLAKSSNQDIFKEFLERKLIDVNSTDGEGETVLMISTRLVQKSNIEELFKIEELDFLKKNNKGQDAQEIAEGINDPKYEAIKDKGLYLKKLLSTLSKSKTNFYQIDQNNNSTTQNSFDLNDKNIRARLGDALNAAQIAFSNNKIGNSNNNNNKWNKNNTNDLFWDENSLTNPSFEAQNDSTNKPNNTNSLSWNLQPNTAKPNDTSKLLWNIPMNRNKSNDASNLSWNLPVSAVKPNDSNTSELSSQSNTDKYSNSNTVKSRNIAITEKSNDASKLSLNQPTSTDKPNDASASTWNLPTSTDKPNDASASTWNLPTSTDKPNDISASTWNLPTSTDKPNDASASTWNLPTSTDKPNDISASTWNLPTSTDKPNDASASTWNLPTSTDKPNDASASTWNLPTSTDKPNDASASTWNLPTSTVKSSSPLSANVNPIDDSLTNKKDEAVSITQDAQKDGISSIKQKEPIPSGSFKPNPIKSKGNNDNIECNRSIEENYSKISSMKEKPESEPGSKSEILKERESNESRFTFNFQQPSISNVFVSNLGGTRTESNESSTRTWNIPRQSEWQASNQNNQSLFSFSGDGESASGGISSVIRDSGKAILANSNEGGEVYQKEKKESISTKFSKEGKQSMNSTSKLTTFEISSKSDKEMNHTKNNESFSYVNVSNESDEVKVKIGQREDEKEEKTDNVTNSPAFGAFGSLGIIERESEGIETTKKEEEEEREISPHNKMKGHKKVKKIKRRKHKTEIKEDKDGMNEYDNGPFMSEGMNFMNPRELMNCNEMIYQSPFIFDPMIHQMQQQEQQQQQWLYLTQMTQMMQMQMAPVMPSNYVNQIPFDIGIEEENMNNNKNKKRNRQRTKDERNNKMKKNKTRK